MKPAPEKILELRNKNAMNQEALAGRAKVSVRTVQRAESGKAIGLQTVQEIASALGVTPSEIIAEDPLAERIESERTYDGETIQIGLRPQTSARALLDLLGDCRDCKLGHHVDLTVDTADAVTDFCEAIRPALPELCPGFPGPPNYGDDAGNDEATRLIQRIRLEATLNNAIKRLGEIDLQVYAGPYVNYMQVARWDPEEGCWATRVNQRPEAVKIAVLRIASQGQRHLTIRIECDPLPF
jgi:transcriptional regulator with XRE-family HTH domain